MDRRGFTVDRGRFDARLLEIARARGVVLFQPAIAFEHDRAPTGWCIKCRTAEDTPIVHSAFLVDATGRRGFLPKSRTLTSPPTVALYGYWTGSDLPARPRILAGPRQWYWGSPVPNGRFNAMVFADSSNLRRRRGPAVHQYRQWIAALNLSESAELDGVALGCDATCYIDGHCAGDGYLKVGEAAFAIDPLSSSGVQAAIQSALAGSICVHTALLRPASVIMARSFYADHVRHVSTQHRQMTVQHYAEHRRYADTEFWRSRSCGVEEKSTSDRRFDIQFIPCAVDHFIEMRPALRHTSLARPVAFVGGRPLISVKA